MGLRVGPGFGRNGGSCVGLAVVGGVGVGLDVVGWSVVGWSVVGSGVCGIVGLAVFGLEGRQTNQLVARSECIFMYISYAFLELE